MFETRPDVSALFDRFRSADQAYLGSSSELEIHAMIVMDAVNDVIVNLDDPDYVIDTLLATGRSHRRFKTDTFISSIFWVNTAFIINKITLGHPFLSVFILCKPINLSESYIDGPQGRRDGDIGLSIYNIVL